MARISWDLDDVYGWTEVGTSAGGRSVWQPKHPVAHPLHPGEHLGLLARLTEDEDRVAVRFSLAHPDDFDRGQVVEVVRRTHPDFDDVLEDPTDTLTRWLESRCRAELLLRPRADRW